METKEAVFLKDLKNKKITVHRTFDAPVPELWNAWTNSDILDLWWAPKPYQAQTKTMDFSEGGSWLYSMKGPKGEELWSVEHYGIIDYQKMITSSDAFCDENGREDHDKPIMDWKKVFSEAGDEALVTIEIRFKTEADMETILKMGFEEGFTAGLNNLDDYLSGK